MQLLESLYDQGYHDPGKSKKMSPKFILDDYFSNYETRLLWVDIVSSMYMLHFTILWLFLKHFNTHHLVISTYLSVLPTPS